MRQGRLGEGKGRRKGNVRMETKTKKRGEGRRVIGRGIRKTKRRDGKEGQEIREVKAVHRKGEERPPGRRGGGREDNTFLTDFTMQISYYIHTHTHASGCDCLAYPLTEQIACIPICLHT